MGLAIIICISFFGFFVTGCFIPVDQEKSKIQEFEYIKTSYSAIIDTSKGTKTFDDIRYFKVNKKDFNVYYIRKYNSYNVELKDQNELKVELKE